MSSQFSLYSRASNETFRSVFLTSELLQDNIFTIDEVAASINTTVMNYYQFPSVALDRYVPLFEESNGNWVTADLNDEDDWDYDKVPVRLDVCRFKHNFWSQEDQEFVSEPLDTYAEVHFLTPDNLGPFDPSKYSEHDVRLYVYSLQGMTISFHYKTLDIGSIGIVPFIWKIELDYDFNPGGGQVKPSIRTTRRYYHYSDYPALVIFPVLNYLLIFFSLFSLFLSAKAVWADYGFYLKTRRLYEIPSVLTSIGGSLDFGIEDEPIILNDDAYSINNNNAYDSINNNNAYNSINNNSPYAPINNDDPYSPIKASKQMKVVTLCDYYPTWESVPYSVKLQFFDKWRIWCMLGNMIGITAGIVGVLAIENYEDIEHAYQILIGLAAFFICVNVIRYLEYMHKFYVLVLTIRMSFLRVTRFLVSCIPIFVGYALFGVIVFSEYSDLFINFSTAAVTLFALLNGDSLLQVFTELDDVYPLVWLVQLYLYTFILFFITAVLNVFIFIIEDAFHAAKSWGKKERKRKKGLHPPKFNIRRLFQVLKLKKKKSKPADILLQSDEKKEEPSIVSESKARLRSQQSMHNIVSPSFDDRTSSEDDENKPLLSSSRGGGGGGGENQSNYQTTTTNRDEPILLKTSHQTLINESNTEMTNESNTEMSNESDNTTNESDNTTDESNASTDIDSDGNETDATTCDDNNSDDSEKSFVDMYTIDSGVDSDESDTDNGRRYMRRSIDVSRPSMSTRSSSSVIGERSRRSMDISRPVPTTSAAYQHYQRSLTSRSMMMNAQPMMRRAVPRNQIDRILIRQIFLRHQKKYDKTLKKHLKAITRFHKQSYAALQTELSAYLAGITTTTQRKFEKK